MFYRVYIKDLINWRKRVNRKPLVLRGARQVGKTSLVHTFGENFNQYIYLNLEKPSDLKIFQDFDDINDLVQAIFLSNNKSLQEIDTLIFIDEIQAYPLAMEMLRYFYEEYPQLHIIVAGSLLESVFKTDISFPVGRVEFLPIRPVSFQEFLMALNENQVLNTLNTVPVPYFAHQILLKLFNTYTLIGGMPEIVQKYTETKDISSLSKTFESILVPYIEDVSKYAKNTTQANVLRHIIKTAMNKAGQRITFEGFGNSNYKSREVVEAFRTLEKTFFLQLIYPITNTQLPLIPNIKKSPRLQLLDTGLVNYFIGIQQELLINDDLTDAYKGNVIEHIVYQEIRTIKKSMIDRQYFWVREKNTSSAEVDLIVPYKNILIPIEIKSGAAGRLRSLHQFIDRANHNFAVRVYAGKLSLEEHQTIAGKKYKLLNLPYYAISKIEEYLNWAFQDNHK
ncbi:MAG: AAA family ATPase [Flavobacteriaceae bacterium]|nr:AAA family ATPase [Flavobacteriaceae bacterium]